MSCALRSFDLSPTPATLHATPPSKPRRRRPLHLLLSPQPRDVAVASCISAGSRDSTPAAGHTSGACSVEFQTLRDCRLGISRYPDFRYNAEGGRGSATGRRNDAAASGDVLVSFDAGTLNVPPLMSKTTTFLGMPLPPFLKIDIMPESLGGVVNRDTGKVDLEFKAKFWFSVGKLYNAPPLIVTTNLTSEEVRGQTRGGKGERLDEGGRCRLVGVARVERIDDLLMDSFLGLPTECLALLNARLLISDIS